MQAYNGKKLVCSGFDNDGVLYEYVQMINPERKLFNEYQKTIESRFSEIAKEHGFNATWDTILPHLILLDNCQHPGKEKVTAWGTQAIKEVYHSMYQRLYDSECALRAGIY